MSSAQTTANTNQLNMYKQMLSDIAMLVKTQDDTAAAKQTAINAKLEEKENLKGGIMNTVLNERFEINNALKYTNDTTRKIRFNELAATDVDYQNVKNELWTLQEERDIAIGEAAYQRGLYRANELMMAFYATNPQ